MNWRNKFLGIGVLILLGCGEDSAPPPVNTVCEPFSKSCTDEGIPEECNALGTGYLPSEACEAGLVCEAGECVEETGPEGGDEPDTNEEEDSDASAECTLNADCEAAYADQLCITAVCEKGSCIPSDLDDGSSCAGGICLEGECIPIICEQGDTVCASDAGKSGGGLYTCGPLGTEFVKQADCDDGDACNGEEFCEAGTCLDGPELDCEDGNPCTLDDCETVTGCVYEEVIGPCEDGSACTVGDGCINGSCVGGVGISCDDGDLCTVDTCDDAEGCVNALIPEGDGCDDGNACTQGESCVSGICSGGAELDCTEGDDNPCLVFDCSPEQGCLTPQPVPDGFGCSDGLLCTVIDGCQNGECAGLQTMNCDDGDPCTADSCQEGSGCSSVLTEGLPCDDGDACTEQDQCTAEGVCQPLILAYSNSCGLPLNSTCAVSGQVGDEVVCTIRVARKHSAVPELTGLQFDLNYDGSLFQVQSFQQESCSEAECVISNLEEATFATGHGMGLNPPALADWVTGGKVLISLFGTPTPLNTAYLSVGGQAVGDSGLFDIVLRLDADISPLAPAYLEVTGIFASTADADLMITSMQDGIIVVNLALE